MIHACVVVIRMKGNEEILAILSSTANDKLKIQYPFYARINPSSGNITMVPYCPLSDETFFEIPTSEIQFVVPASEEVSTKFLTMAADQPADEELDEDDEPMYMVSQLITGNSTKH